ncbi:ATP-binding protein [Streptomyces sp. NPDC050703]|uniref:ATP-binding protein n=1 Tax=Streptomyces sp. NPDC050703 TaxID=3157218 RepID=UPI003432E339
MGVGSEGDGAADHTVLARASHALHGSAGCIAEARRLAAAFLDAARGTYDVIVSAQVKDLTLLVVSELVTNAYKYAPGPMLMNLCITRHMVEISVWDSDPTLPTAHHSDPGRVGQHGLEIVTRIARHFTVRRELVGKRITARLALNGIPAQRFCP